MALIPDEPLAIDIQRERRTILLDKVIFKIPDNHPSSLDYVKFDSETIRKLKIHEFSHLPRNSHQQPTTNKLADTQPLQHTDQDDGSDKAHTLQSAPLSKSPGVRSLSLPATHAGQPNSVPNGQRTPDADTIPMKARASPGTQSPTFRAPPLQRSRISFNGGTTDSNVKKTKIRRPSYFSFGRKRQDNAENQKL